MLYFYQRSIHNAFSRIFENVNIKGQSTVIRYFRFYRYIRVCKILTFCGICIMYPPGKFQYDIRMRLSNFRIRKSTYFAQLLFKVIEVNLLPKALHLPHNKTYSWFQSIVYNMEVVSMNKFICLVMIIYVWYEIYEI